MRLTVLGSGSAFEGCGCNAGYIIDEHVLVDCGAPVHVLAHRIDVSLRELELILITHFHADHTFMLPLVLGAHALTDAPPRKGLVIAGPWGIREYTRRLLIDGYGQQIQELVERNTDLEYIGLQDGSDVQLAGYRVRAHAVVHSLGPSLAYQLTDAAGATIGFSGDSAMCSGLRRAIAGTELFVCECTSWDNPVPGGHLWSGEVAQLIADHPDTRFVISHLTERRQLAGAIVAHDLLTLDVTPS